MLHIQILRHIIYKPNPIHLVHADNAYLMRHLERTESSLTIIVASGLCNVSWCDYMRGWYSVCGCGSTDGRAAWIRSVFSMWVWEYRWEGSVEMFSIQYVCCEALRRTNDTPQLFSPEAQQLWAQTKKHILHLCNKSLWQQRQMCLLAISFITVRQCQISSITVQQMSQVSSPL